MSQFSSSDIRRYYDRHTASFVRFGQGGGSIHRAVWGPGTTNREQAFHDVDRRIAALIGQRPASSSLPHVVDLGCGVGASLCYLAERLPMRGTGITLSPAQAAIATRRIAAAGLADRVRCIEGDYCDIPAEVEPADVAFAVESFVHGPSPARFFEQCARLVKPGGVLIVCDDVRRGGRSAEAEKAIETFVTGWQINALLEPDDMKQMAEAAGFEHVSTTDLTPFLELRRARDHAIATWLALLGWLRLESPRLGPVAGGHALQTCLARGWVGYELVVFKRRAIPSPAAR